MRGSELSLSLSRPYHSIAGQLPFGDGCFVSCLGLDGLVGLDHAVDNVSVVGDVVGLGWIVRRSERLKMGREDLRSDEIKDCQGVGEDEKGVKASSRQALPRCAAVRVSRILRAEGN